MGRTLLKAKGRRESGAFLAIPFNVITSDNYRKLSAKGVKLLFDVASQLRMKRGGTINNGDLCITAKVMKECGWNSRESLYMARDELIHYGFVEKTRRAMQRNQCHLYAITFFSIDYCNGKLDVKETRVPSNLWKQAKRKWKRPKRKNKLNSLYRNSTNVVPIVGTIHLNQWDFNHENDTVKANLPTFW